MPPARHQIAPLSTHTNPVSGAVGYVLGGVSYGLVPTQPLKAETLAEAHAAVLDIVQLDAVADAGEAKNAAALAQALHLLAHDLPLSEALGQVLLAEHPRDTDLATIRTDGSADKGAGGENALSIGYLINGQPYGVALYGQTGNEGIAEREAITTALRHAQTLGYTHFEVRSDHKFHTRRYDEDLIFRGRRKSASLERLDALVESLQPHVTFAYTENLDTDAPHRLALHARALTRLSLGLPLSRAQAMALRRVHYALRVGGDVLF